MEEKKLTGYPAIDKPWLKLYNKKAIEAPLPECTIYEYLRAKNTDNMNRSAIRYYGASITYTQMFDKVDAVAASLSTMGVSLGSVVTIAMFNQPEAIYLLLALNKIGAIANFVFGGAPQAELKHQLLSTNSHVVFSLDLFTESFLSIAKETSLKKLISVPITQSMSAISRLAVSVSGKIEKINIRKSSLVMKWKEFLCVNRKTSSEIQSANDPNAVAFITYTGGTTGGSKGVMLTNKATLAVAEQYMRGEPELHRSSIWMQIIPFFTAYGITCSLIIPLAVGMTLIVRLPLADSLLQLCKKFKPNHIVSGPAVWESFAEANVNLDLSYLIAPISGGDMLRESAEEKINAYLERCGCQYKLMNGYGMTEVGAAVACNFKDKYEFGSVGAPFVKNVIAAFDIATGNELPYYKEGEICICAPSMMIGYVAQTSETNNIMRRHNDGNIWIHSGDLGYVSPAGFIHISGRLKRYTLSYKNGVAKKIFSLDIEKILLQHEIVLDCAVVPAADEEKVYAPVAYIVPKEDSWSTAQMNAELVAWSNVHLDELYRPKRYYFIKEFPRTKLGKVDYMALERMATKEEQNG